MLITGESGVGKEVIADEIFKNSKRNKKPFIKINCASIPANLLESELLAMKRGPFPEQTPKESQGFLNWLTTVRSCSMKLEICLWIYRLKLLRAIQSRGNYPYWRYCSDKA